MSRVDTKRISSALGAGIDEQAAAAAGRLLERAEREGLAEIAYASYETPVGTAHLAATDRGVLSVGLPNLGEESFLAHISEGLSPRVLELPARLDRARRQLDEYFAGKRHEFELELDWRLVRPGFYSRVLRNTARLPFGATSTYGEIAARAGNPRAYRAAGTALGRNPIPIVVPCHRVLRSGGDIGGYGGGPEMKEFLLRLEGSLPT
jgi:methylated-DNA-[protein]-cysteine S-methyltransferase